MSDKSLVSWGIIVGSTVGGFVPMLWGASFLSFSSIVTSAIGAVIGIYVVYKLTS